MKRITKIKMIIFFLGISLTLSVIINTNLNSNVGITDKYPEDNNDTTLEYENLKISANSEPIYINNNWTDAKAAGICTGEGTKSKPYVIQNLIIDAKNSTSGIYIANSDVYFKIKNCRLYNSAEWSYAGIRLWNVNNGLLISNNVSNNNGCGIHLYDSADNSISGNTANYNHYGIYIGRSDNNTISGNICENNGNIGIFLRGEPYGGESNDNIISKNIVNNNDNGGIGTLLSDNNIISGNTVYYNNRWGIMISTSDYNNITGNIVNHNGETGIDVDTSMFNNIYVNCFNNTLNAVDDGSDNHWDNGVKGNYWADYNGSDTDDDGIGDVPYNITGSAGSQDNFPLMKCPITKKKEGIISGYNLFFLLSILTLVAILVRKKLKKS